MTNPQVEKPKIVSTQNVRQGVTGHNVRYVLIISIVAAIVAMVTVVIFVAGIGKYQSGPLSLSIRKIQARLLSRIARTFRARSR